MITIGISACFSYPDAQRKVFAPKTLSYMENDMARYLTKNGILPVLIPDVADEYLNPIIEMCDGFIFQGGTDLAPGSYNESPIAKGKWMGDPVRDVYELKLFERAIKTGKPILGICRGMQLMNVFFGGTLYQDTLTQRPDSIVHRDADKYDSIAHGVSFVEGKILDRIYSADSSDQINSIHHQSVKDLGKDLEILASCPEDGVIEAIGFTAKPDGWIMGVQWHPEFSHTLGNQVINPDTLYEYFLTQVKSIIS